MKLEAVNGNLMSLTVKVPPAEETVAEGDGEGEGGGGAEEQQQQQQKQQEEEGEGDKEVGGVGKKKGTRKKRSLNWEEAERCLLVEVIKAKVEYVENRNVDAKSIKAKRLAWLQITKQFNALNFRHRSLEQIQVQWRSMKNSAKREYQQKNPKAGTLEPMDMIEFMEEMQKDPASARSQTRGNGVVLKKELLEMDDEDTPLAALPTSTNASEDTLQTSTIALPSPPPSAESQNDTQQATPTRNKKKSTPSGAQKAQLTVTGTTITNAITTSKQKRQRSQNSTQSDGVASVNSTADTQPANLSLATLSATPMATSPPADDKYKKQLFELIKRARLADIDYARKEHEQKLRFEQMEHELKLNYYRQQEELKLRLLREEHEARMRQCQAEHEARMRVYTFNVRNNNAQTKLEQNATDAGACN